MSITAIRPFPEDIIILRMVTLAAHGVPEKDRRTVAIAQLELEREQARSEREMTEGRSDDGAMMVSARYDGADPKIASLFEEIQHKRLGDKHTGGSKSKSKFANRKKVSISSEERWAARERAS